MIDCPNGDVRDLLPDYLHDRLASSERMSVERHLAECAACRDELTLLRDLRGTLRRAPRIDVAAVAAAIPAYRPAARKSWARDWRVAAAIVAIAVGGTSIALVGGKQQQRHFAASQGTPVTQAPVGGAASTTAATLPSVASPQPHAVPPEQSVARAEPGAKSTSAPRDVELAVAGTNISDLSDSELSDLIGDLDSLDAVPTTDVESTESFLTGRHRGRHE
jgi:anti-sigma factor RsiW